MSNEKGPLFTVSLCFDRVLEPTLRARIDAEVDTSDCSLHCSSDSSSQDNLDHEDTKATSKILILDDLGASVANPANDHWTVVSTLLEW